LPKNGETPPPLPPPPPPKKAGASVPLGLGNIKGLLKMASPELRLALLSHFTFYKGKEMVFPRVYLSEIMDDVEKAQDRAYDEKRLWAIALERPELCHILWLLTCPTRLEAQLKRAGYVDTALGQEMLRIKDSGGLSVQTQSSKEATEAGRHAEDAVVRLIREVLPEGLQVLTNVIMRGKDGKQIFEFDAVVCSEGINLLSILSVAWFESAEEAKEYLVSIGALVWEVAGIKAFRDGKFSTYCVEVKLVKADKNRYDRVAFVNLTAGPSDPPIHVFCPTDHTRREFIPVRDVRKMFEDCAADLLQPIHPSKLLPESVKRDRYASDGPGSYYRMPEIQFTEWE
jgi:hypothetical protein